MSVEVFAVALVLAVGLLVGRLVANRTGLPEAAVYVIVGVAARLLPGVSQVRLSPDLVLLLFLPPLIHYAAFFSDPRESLKNLVAVLGQAVGLVVATALPVLLRRLGLRPDEDEMSESVRARLAAVEAALRELDELASDADGPDRSQVQALR